MKEQSPGFPFDAEPPAELVERRAALTFQEREISALERISDQLALLKDMFAVCREQDPPAVTSTSADHKDFGKVRSKETRAVRTSRRSQPGSQRVP